MGPDKSLRRRALYGPGWWERRSVPTHWGLGLGELLDHDHVWSIIAPAKERTPRLPQWEDGCPLYWLLQNLVRKAPGTKGSRPVGREPLKKVAGACLDGFALLQRRTMQLTGAQGNRQEDIARERTRLSLSVEVEDTGFLRRVQRVLWPTF